MDLAAVRDHVPERIEGTREAAVLIPLIDTEDGPSILFTRRADDLDDHPGQMSFPGGVKEPADESLWSAALREANEEIQLDPATVTRVGRLDDLHTVTDYVITPFVATVPEGPYVPSDAEVAEIVIVPIESLLDHERYRREQRSHPRAGTLWVHFFDVHDSPVWGATAEIVTQLLELLYGWEPPESADA